ncbi:Ig-specific serine endopeptidase MIP [Mycoplasmopsis pulmonis]|uniref:Ig-specific serine endopeptidase MIP n=1 Tax=Mycoplasmopsis pulmonis TaxID=2107 RepID=UPI001004F0C0|nr:hypothetical protein [Mycoplasmopsis pulmonis]VEU68272.1 Membrane-associated lipoprotein precursor [Mycoplasmopsis pulmonis]
MKRKWKKMIIFSSTLVLGFAPLVLTSCLNSSDDKKVNSLQEQINNLTTQRKTLEDKISMLNSANKTPEIQKQIEDSNKELQKLTKDIEAKKKEIDSINPSKKPIEIPNSKTPNYDNLVFDTKTITINKYEPLGRSKEHLYATDIQLESLELVTSDSNFSLKAKALIPDRDAQGRSISNTTGKIYILVEVTNVHNKSKRDEKILIDGFKTSPFNIGSDGKIESDASSALKSDLQEYVAANSLERFHKDNPKYLDILKRQLGAGNFDITKYREDIKRNSTAESEFDKKAKELNQDSYENQLVKGFTVPVYDQSGKNLGLNIKEETVVKGPSWVDSVNRNSYSVAGLARTLPNEMYKKIALQTYSVDVFNPKKNANGEIEDAEVSTKDTGTMWILDYEKTNNGKYPTKWYFGTNVHVIDKVNAETKNLGITKFNKNVPIRTTLKTTLENDFMTQIGIVKKSGQSENPFKVVYTATDYLRSNPSDYLVEEQKTKYKDFQEFIDFAVLEIDFTKLDLQTRASAEEFAREFTNGYAENTADHIKFLKNSYLKDSSKIDVPLSRAERDAKYKGDSLFALGFPSTAGDYFLDKYQDSRQIEFNKVSTSLWVNGESSWYGQLSIPENGEDHFKDQIKNGNYLSYTLGYRSFIDKPGIADLFILSPIETAKRDPETQQIKYFEYDGKKYLYSGLSYAPKHYSPIGGSSGSSIRNQNNELVSVWHTGATSTNSGISSAFRSEGFDYKGLYGQYNLGQYDLIYGGGKDQKEGASYREALKKLYGDSFKTNLFENIKEVPNDFKFDNSAKANNS